MEQIINSLLENDLYKFSMGQAIYHQFSDYKTTWSFKCRNEGIYFTEDELEYLHHIRWLKGSYIDFLRLWHPRFEDYEIKHEGEKGLTIETKGTWLNTSMYEVPTLAIVNEVYFRMSYDMTKLEEEFKEKLDQKIADLRSGKYNIGSFSEFGLRRRLNGKMQDLAIRELGNNNYPDSCFIGTSNVYLAKKYSLTPVGTMAHEWVQAVGQGNHKHNPAYSNWYMMDAWIKEYGILNGIALTDTITTDCFLKDFQLTYATLF